MKGLPRLPNERFGARPRRPQPLRCADTARVPCRFPARATSAIAAWSFHPFASDRPFSNSFVKQTNGIVSISAP
ncbi:phage DNA packaging protein J [Rhodobacteraceae bacterium B1Z28]|uniref:Phage DNA packaging protein J n=1 Tax=Ruegeria haliotis TaxID=2747601 RepID=A0ABX2PU57_9RHOB|nr:phage DNA packaging protein J [Ruegeria haliotis]